MELSGKRNVDLNHKSDIKIKETVYYLETIDKQIWYSAIKYAANMLHIMKFNESSLYAFLLHSKTFRESKCCMISIIPNKK